VARAGNGACQYTPGDMSTVWRVLTSRRWTEFPTREQITRGLCHRSRVSVRDGNEGRGDVRDVAEGVRLFSRETDEVVFADWNYLD
jgi:hypothetical protein